MSYAQNKSLNEYGDLKSVHHADIDRADYEDPQVNEPPRLVVADGPGNLVVIKWTKGDSPIPAVCAGHWNHKGKAQDAINSAAAEIKASEDRDTHAAFLAEKQAREDLEAITAAKEVAAEEARIIKEAEAKVEAKPVTKAKKSYTGK